MMDKEKLRQADIFSGAAIVLVGAFIAYEALQMPMKDSWGGVQNVWYVSPAIFPLFVGAIIMLLGGLLVKTALKEVGLKALGQVSAFLGSPNFLQFLKQKKNIRFYAIVTVLLSFVFLFIPRVDFFLAAILFLLAFISIFYLEDYLPLMRLFRFYGAQILIFILFLLLGLTADLSDWTAYPGDCLVLFFILSLGSYAYAISRGHAELKKKYRTCLIVALVAPMLIGIIFKYFLLVPMPFEGMVVELLDFIWYYEF